MIRKYNTLQIRRRPRENTNITKPLLELPAAKSILSLLCLPPVLQDLPPSHLTHSTAFRVEHDCASWSDGELGLKFTMTIGMDGHESIEDFTTRSALQLANFFNAFVIPVFLLATLKTQNKTPPPILQKWQKEIKLTYKYTTQKTNIYIQRASVPLVHKTTKNADQVVHFFAVPGEDIKQQLCNLERIAENRIKSFEICVLIPNTFISAYTMEFALYNAISLNQVAFYMQLLPLYRSILINSSRDYGITFAPYKLGVGCAVLQAEQELTDLARQNDTQYYQQGIKSCVFIHGAQTINFAIPDSFLHNSPLPIRMPMLSLFEVSEMDIPESQLASMLPYCCTVRQNVEYHQLLKQFLEARNIKVEEAPVTKNLCTVLRIFPNPKIDTKKAFSLKSLAGYLHLLTASCKTVFGNKQRIMAYAQTVQSVNGIPNVTLLHILDTGTQPKKQHHALVGEDPNVLIYDEACHRVTESAERAVVPKTKDQISQLHNALSKLFTKAARNPTDNAVKAIYRGLASKHYIDVQHFLESGRVQCILVLQDVQTPAKTISSIQESTDTAHSRKKNKTILDRNSTTSSKHATSTMPLASPQSTSQPQTATNRGSAHYLPHLHGPSSTVVITEESGKNPVPSAQTHQSHERPIDQQHQSPPVNQSDGTCHFSHTDIRNIPCMADVPPADTKSLHLNPERSTLLVINANREPNMPSMCTQPATESPQLLATSAAYDNKLSKAFRNALFTFIGTMAIVAVIGLVYFLDLRSRLDLKFMFRYDLIAIVGLASVVSIVAAATFAVMAREALVTRRAASSTNTLSRVPSAEEASAGAAGVTPSLPTGARGAPEDQQQADPQSNSNSSNSVDSSETYPKVPVGGCGCKQEEHCAPAATPATECSTVMPEKAEPETGSPSSKQAAQADAKAATETGQQAPVSEVTVSSTSSVANVTPCSVPIAS